MDYKSNFIPKYNLPRTAYKGSGEKNFKPFLVITEKTRKHLPGTEFWQI